MYESMHHSRRLLHFGDVQPDMRIHVLILRLSGLHLAFDSLLQVRHLRKKYFC